MMEIILGKDGVFHKAIVSRIYLSEEAIEDLKKVRDSESPCRNYAGLILDSIETDELDIEEDCDEDCDVDED